MIKIGCLFFSVALLSSVFAKETVFYTNRFFSHVYEAPNIDSHPLTVLPCSTPLRVKEKKEEYYQVAWGEREGFIREIFLAEKRPTDCLADQYPRFVDLLKLSVSDAYYWARLQDRFSHARPRVPLKEKK